MRGISLKPELKKFLKAKAQTLKPVILTGQNGLSQAVIDEIERSLDHHELIKIRLSAADRSDRRAMCDEICQKTNADLIQSIGHVVTIYRKSRNN